MTPRAVSISALQTEAIDKAVDATGTLMPSDDPAWSLHPQLKKDTIDIGDLPLCRVLVIKDAHYPWLLLVPRRRDAVEIIDLDEVEQAQLMTEISPRRARPERDHQMRQAEHRSPRQCGAATARPCHRTPHQRRRLAASGLGGDAAARA